MAAIGLLFAFYASAADILVYNNDDSGPGSLRRAITDNNASGLNTIVFSNTVTGAITLTSGELLITRSVTIRGPGPEVLAVNGNAASRIFHISNVVDAFIFGLTISNGAVSGNFPGHLGAGIWNDHSRLTLSNCVVSGNHSPGIAGAIYNDGSSTNRRATLRIMRSTISGNSAHSGGAIYNYASPGTASVSIATSTINGNTANGIGGVGGAIWSDGNFGSATLGVTSSTISGNSARHQAGAIYSSGAGGGFAGVSLDASTFSGNSASNQPGGIFVNGANGSATLTMNNTILKRGASGPNIAINGVQANSFGYNLSDDSGGGVLTHATDQLNTDPLLGPLGENGGPTLTHALLPGSPAIDKGGSFGLTSDQRGEPRPFDFSSIGNASGGDGSDIGAFEVGPPRLSIQKDGNNAVLSWPAYSPNFILYFSSDATAPFWITAGGFPGLNGNEYRHTNGPIAEGRFFRLRGN